MEPEEQEHIKIITIRLLIEGRVQKVGFREWMKQTAQKSQINGWVRNRADERVEAMVSGEEEKVRELIQKCHTGPAMAAVRRIREFPMMSERVGKGFQVLL